MFDITISLIKNKLNNYSQFPTFHFDMKQEFDEEEMKFMIPQEQIFFRYRNIQRKHQMQKESYNAEDQSQSIVIRGHNNMIENSPLPKGFKEASLENSKRHSKEGSKLFKSGSMILNK